MMEFRKAKAKIVQLLGDHAGGNFRVAGYQGQGDSPDGTTGGDRLVRVFFESGEFPKSGSTFKGPVKHEVTFGVYLIVSAKASGDLATLNDQDATPSEIATALSEFNVAVDAADGAFDEMAELVYQILMDNRHHYLDTSDEKDGSGELDSFGDRWVSGVEKDEPMPRGKVVTITGSLRFNGEVTEDVTGAAAVSEELSTGVVDVEIDGYDTEGTSSDTAETGTIAP